VGIIEATREGKCKNLLITSQPCPPKLCASVKTLATRS